MKNKLKYVFLEDYRKILDTYFFIFHLNKYLPRYKRWKFSKSDVKRIQLNECDVTFQLVLWLTISRLNFV